MKLNTRMGNFILIFVVLTSLPVLSLAQNISQKAKEHMLRGEAEIEMASGPEGFKAAIREFTKAAEAAPNWSVPRYNLAFVCEKTGMLDCAINNYAKYLKLAPNAEDKSHIESKLFKLKYKKERVDQENNNQRELIRNITTLDAGSEKYGGYINWLLKGTCNNANVVLAFRGTADNLQARVPKDFSVYDDSNWVPAKFDGKTIKFKQIFFWCDIGGNGIDCPVETYYTLKVDSPTKLSGKGVSTRLPSRGTRAGDNSPGGEKYECVFTLSKN